MMYLRAGFSCSAPDDFTFLLESHIYAVDRGSAGAEKVSIFDSSDIPNPCITVRVPLLTALFYTDAHRIIIVMVGISISVGTAWM